MGSEAQGPNGGSIMKVWMWLLTAAVGLATAFGGVIYGNAQESIKDAKSDIRQLQVKDGEHDKSLVGISKDTDTLSRDVKELKDTTKDGFGSINKRLDAIIMGQQLREENRDEPKRR